MKSIVTFLKSLTGELPKERIAKPELPPEWPEDAEARSELNT